MGLKRRYNHLNTQTMQLYNAKEMFLSIYAGFRMLPPNYTVSKTPPLFLAITRKSIVGFL